jgi:hypothetical protein
MDGALHSDSNTSKSPVQDKTLYSLGARLYYFAWFVEVIAVFTGLGISLMVGMDAFNKIAEQKSSIDFGDYVNTAISVFPFFLVAIVEISKIPVAGAAYYAKSRKWRIVFTATLVFLALITFETALNGFERNFTNLTFVINKHKEELATTEDRIEARLSDRIKAKELTAEWIEEQYNKRRAELSEDRDTQSRSVQSKIIELNASLESEMVNSLRDEKKGLEAQLTALVVTQRKEIDQIQNSHSKQQNSLSSELSERRSQLVERINNAEKALAAAISHREKAITEAGFFSEGSVKKEQNKNVAAAEKRLNVLQKEFNGLTSSGQQNELSSLLSNKLDTINKRYAGEIRNLRNQISAKSREISRATATKEQDVAAPRKMLQQELASIEAKFTKQQLANTEDRARLMDKLKNNQSHIDKLDELISELELKRTELRNLINREAGDNQVYRLTMSWTGAKTAADVKRDEVAITAAIWFGSLAAVVALTGILLALASYVLQEDSRKPNEQRKKSRMFSKLVNSLRRFTAYRRKLLREPNIEKVYLEKEIPKEVIREVPVEKVVLQEVPIQIVKKEIVHVPIYTNDPSLVDRNFRKQPNSQDYAEKNSSLEAEDS